MTGREVPILFRAEMVRAILAGRKQQTRRLIKPQPVEREDAWFTWGYEIGGPRTGAPRSVTWHAETWKRECGSHPIDVYASWRAGDLLWVRETWRQADDPSSCYHYRADLDEPEAPGCWRPAIHMPRDASRILLRVTSVESQRVQDITEDDAKAEGVAPFFERFTAISREQRLTSGELAADAPCRAAFAVLWDEINDAEGTRWIDNPWIWRIVFEVERPAATQKGAA